MLLKNNKLLLLFLCLFLIKIAFGNNVNRRSYLIDSLFNILNEESIIYTKVSTKYDTWGSFYKINSFEEYNKERLMASEATSIKECNSIKHDVLRDIFLLYSNENKELCWNLIDSTGNIMYDLLITYCGNGKIFSPPQISNTNEKEYNTIYLSYYNWYSLFKDKGLGFLLENKISPLSFCSYSWINEIEYVPISTHNSTIIINTANKILKDSLYLERFIKSNKLHDYYNDLSNQEIVYVISILSLVNIQSNFCPDIRLFNISPKNQIKSDIKTTFEILTTKYFVNKDIIFSDFLKKAGVEIFLSM